MDSISKLGYLIVGRGNTFTLFSVWHDYEDFLQVALEGGECGIRCYCCRSY